MTPSRTRLHVASTFHIDSFLLYFISFMAPQVRSRCLHLSEGRSDISTVYILHRNRHLRPTLTTPRWSPRRRAHVIIIPRNICRVEKDCHDRKYTGFALGAAEGSANTNPSSWLGARSVKSNKGERRARARMGLPIKICQWCISMGQRGRKRSSGFGKRCRSGVQEKLSLDKQHLQIKHVPP